MSVRVRGFSSEPLTVAIRMARQKSGYYALPRHAFIFHGQSQDLQCRGTQRGDETAPMVGNNSSVLGSDKRNKTDRSGDLHGEKRSKQQANKKPKR